MRLVVTMAAAGLALAACGPKAKPAAPQALAPPTRAVADPPPASPADEEMLSRAIAVRAALGPQLQAKNCVTAGSYSPCRNLSIPCAWEEDVSAWDHDGGVMRRLVFATGFESQSTQTGQWEPGGELLRVDITTDGGWHSVGAADRNGASCAGEMDNLAVRRIRFIP